MPSDPEPKVPTYEYYGELMNMPAATVDIDAVTKRLNVLGQQGWKLITFVGTTAWFVRGP